MVIRKFELETKLKDENQRIRSGQLRNDHPLDSSPEFTEFLEACRRGDLGRCQELISAGVNINAKDRFDYTPLVVASLCGHFELVQLLLDSGASWALWALADPDSFERERAVYNALNNKIRNLLLSYDYTKAADPLQPWSSHITSLLVRDRPPTSDITLSAPTEDFHLHKFLLSARSPYFMRKFADAPETVTWRLPHAIPVEAFRIVLRYLYLGNLPHELVRPDSARTEEEVFRGIDKLCRQLELDRLWEAVLSINDRRLARQRQQDEVERAQHEVETFFQNTVLKHRVEIEADKVAEVKWPRHNAIFADCLLRADEAVQEDEETSRPNGNSGTNGSSGRSVLFPVHKLFLIRSPYFETMFSSEFLEARDAEHLHVIKMDCSPAVLQLVLRFLYTEKADCPLEHALDLLYTADMLLLEKLKTKAAVAISTLGSGTNNALVDRTRRTPRNGPKKQASSSSSPSPSSSSAAASTPSSSSSSSSPPAAAETETDDDDEEPEMEPINVYDVIHAAWDLKVQRLEEFAARYLASRLEDYIDDDEFAELIRESALRVRDRHETDTIELLDDIRYYLGERFKFRFEGGGLDELLRNGEVGGGEKEGGEGVASSSGEDGGSGGGGGGGGGFKTLDGQIAEDEFSSDAVNYHVLMEKIDRMLERLKLDA
ncbi:hypothetical protein VTJ49DRAFT_7689 [Mycothermus thermophilus]|uniref:BTB domain-containing protein n=1 Tax=Humicola insolens TaxID=85995 RepID=A0ABR3VGI0_HUMIN